MSPTLQQSLRSAVTSRRPHTGGRVQMLELQGDRRPLTAVFRESLKSASLQARHRTFYPVWMSVKRHQATDINRRVSGTTAAKLRTPPPAMRPCPTARETRQSNPRIRGRSLRSSILPCNSSKFRAVHYPLRSLLVPRQTWRPVQRSMTGTTSRRRRSRIVVREPRPRVLLGLEVGLCGRRVC